MKTATVGWLAKNGLARYRPMLMLIEAGLFLIGGLFWADTMLGGAAFTEEIWGALAYSMPAAVWALLHMSASAMTLAGLIKPVRNWMVISGAAGSCLQYLVLSWSAIFDGGVAVIGLYASVIFLPMHIWLIFEAAFHDPR